MTENVIKIDGKDYDANAFSAEQKYAVAQIQSLQAKQTEQKMLLDQAQQQIFLANAPSAFPLN